MLFYLSEFALKLAKNTPWQGMFSFLRLFSYITFRSAGAAGSANTNTVILSMKKQTTMPGRFLRTRSWGGA